MEQGTRVGLGPIDRLVLLGAWLLSCAAVYGLGFYTGSYTQDRLAGEEDRVVRLPVTVEPPPVGQRPKSGDDLTFWDALESSGPRIKPGENIPARPGPAPAVPAPPSKATASAENRAGKPTTRTTPKPGTAAPAGKRPEAKAVASSAPAKVSPRPGSAVTRVSAPAGDSKRPAVPAPAKVAPRAQPTATASVPRAAPAVAPRRPAPPRKAPPPPREASAAAD